MWTDSGKYSVGGGVRSNQCVTGNWEPAMLTRMSEDDWDIVLEVFDAVQSRRGDPGHDDRKFLEALHFFTGHSVTWRALPAEFGNWNSVWKWFWQLSRSGVFEVSFSCWRRPARPRTLRRCSTAPWCGRMCRLPVQKGAAKSGARPFARRFLVQDPPQDGFRWLTARIPSDRRRGQRLHPTGDVPRYRPRHHAPRCDQGQGLQLRRERATCRSCRIAPVIPHRENAKNRPRFFPKLLYKTRARIEQQWAS